MKRTIINIVVGLMFLAGFGILVYPTVSNQWNTYRQSQLIDSYEASVQELEQEDFTGEWELARSYNQTVKYNALYSNAFGESDGSLQEGEYWKVLNIADDGIMGYLSIPKINVRLAVYHGSEETVLQTGIGHIDNTHLPIGGEGTHSVLSGHRGLPSARLFTDIDQMELGDMLYIHVLDETLAYQVDQISDMVDKDDADALEAALALEEGQDYVSLFTCTPYGVNSHRLIVRGTRVPYEGEEHVEATLPETMVQAVQDYYMIYLVLGLAVTILAIIVMRVIIKRREKRNM